MQAAVTPIRAVPHLRLSGLALGAGAALAGLVLGQLSNQPTNRSRPPCEACNGDGYIDCLCARWSNAAAAPPACTKCRGSLRTRCPRCRGGGTVVPTMLRVPVPVRVKEHADRLLGLFAFVVGGLGLSPARVGRRRHPLVVSGLVAVAPLQTSNRRQPRWRCA